MLLFESCSHTDPCRRQVGPKSLEMRVDNKSVSKHEI